MTALKGYRTLILVTLGLVLQLWQATAPAQTFPPEWMPFIDGLFTIAFGVLRLITNTPFGKATAAPLGADDIASLLRDQMAAFVSEIEAKFEPRLVAEHPSSVPASTVIVGGTSPPASTT